MTSTMDSLIRSSLKHLELKLHAFLSSLTSSPTAAGAPAAALELLAADDALTRALETLRVHQRNYRRLVELKKEAGVLEGKVKETVREVMSLGEEIEDVRREDGLDGEDSEEEDDDGEEDGDGDGDGEGMEVKKEGEEDVYMSGTSEYNEARDTSTSTSTDDAKKKKLKPRKEINYHLLLNFARRISKYSNPPTPSEQLPPQPTDPTSDIHLSKPPTPIPSPPLSRSPSPILPDHTSLLQPPLYLPAHTLHWLNETSQLLHSSSSLPFPPQEKIRMGLMGRLQGQAAESEDTPDPETQLERIMAGLEKEARERYQEEEMRKRQQQREREDSLDMDLLAGASPSHFIEEEDGGAVVRPKPVVKGFSLDFDDGF